MIFLKLYNKLVSEANTELRFPIFARVPFLQRPSAQPQREREIKKKNSIWIQELLFAQLVILQEKNNPASYCMLKEQEILYSLCL